VPIFYLCIFNTITLLYVADDTCAFQAVPSCVGDYSREAFSRRMVSGSSTASGLNCFVRIADLIPSRYGVLFEVDDYPARQPSDRVTTFFPLDHPSVPHARGFAYGYDLGDGVIGECMFTYYAALIYILFHASGKTSVPLARHRYDADALGGDDASVNRSDNGNDSASTERR
jgi:hypothetical protein